MKNLHNFLLDDVRALIDAINKAPELAEMKIRNDGGSGFDTLGDFASYWSRHIDKLD